MGHYAMTSLVRWKETLAGSGGYLCKHIYNIVNEDVVRWHGMKLGATQDAGRVV